MIRRMSRRFDDFIRKTQRPEWFRIHRYQPVEEFLPDFRVSVFAVSEQRQHLAEQEGKARRATAFKGILSLLKPLDCLGMQNNPCVCHRQNVV